MPVQQAFNVLETWSLYALAACGLYLASVGCRHFAFASGLAFLAVPYAMLLTEDQLGGLGGALCGLLLCAGLGAAYRILASALARRGARSGQLLVVSLAILAGGENIALMTFGGASISPFSHGMVKLLAWDWITFTAQDILVVLVAGACLGCLGIFWHVSLLGKAARGLIESRWSLMLQGFNVELLETIAAVAGFVLMGMAGLLWSGIARVRPPMALEMAVIGVVAMIVGPMLSAGLPGMVYACLAAAILRLLMALRLEGDWSLTSVLLLLGLALALRKARALQAALETQP